MRQILFVIMLLLASTSYVELVAQKSTDTSKEWRKYVKEKRKAEKKEKKAQRKRDKIARKEAAKSRSAKRKADQKRWEKERAARKSKASQAGRSTQSSKRTKSAKASKSSKPSRTSSKASKASPSKSRSAVVKEALKYRGIKYRYGGESPSRGFDCSGFVQYVYRNKGTQLPRTAAQQATQGKSVRKSDLREGDLLFFSSGGKIDHVGIVVSKKGEELTMIHSGSSSGVVITEVNQSSYWKKRWKKSRRVQ